MTKSESTADILRRIAQKEKRITVSVGGDTIELIRPEAQEYQRLLGLAVEMSDSGATNLGLGKSIDLCAEILAASVEDLSLEDAREVLICVGLDSPLAKACLRILGTAVPNLDDPAGKSSA